MNLIEWSYEQRAAVTEEMNRISQSHAFKTSKRCLDLLDYLFEHALAGNQDGIKERTLGVEVFGRDPDYITSDDAIVRQTASEIRKRLAQCYQEPGRFYPIRIGMAQGRYLLEFEFTNQAKSEYAVEVDTDQPSLHLPDQHPARIESSPKAPAFSLNFFLQKWTVWIGVALCISAACVWVSSSYFIRPADYMLWKPLLESNGQFIVCVGDSATSATSIPPDKARDVPYTDADVTNMITNRLSALGRRTALRLSSEITLDDLGQSPAVLVGSFNNRWSMTLLSSLRYTVKTDPATNDRWIEDAKAPSKREWIVEGGQNFGDHFPTFAVVSRFMSPETRQWIMTVVGLNGNGTEAAGALITNPEFAKFLPKNVRSQNNLQIVLKTDVINGNSGPPQIVAVYSW